MQRDGSQSFFNPQVSFACACTISPLTVLRICQTLPETDETPWWISKSIACLPLNQSSSQWFFSWQCLQWLLCAPLLTRTSAFHSFRHTAWKQKWGLKTFSFDRYSQGSQKSIKPSALEILKDFIDDKTCSNWGGELLSYIAKQMNLQALGLHRWLEPLELAQIPWATWCFCHIYSPPYAWSLRKADQQCSSLSLQVKQVALGSSGTSPGSKGVKKLAAHFLSISRRKAFGGTTGPSRLACLQGHCTVHKWMTFIMRNANEKATGLAGPACSTQASFMLRHPCKQCIKIL